LECDIGFVVPINIRIQIFRDWKNEKEELDKDALCTFHTIMLCKPGLFKVKWLGFKGSAVLYG